MTIEVFILFFIFLVLSMWIGLGIYNYNAFKKSIAVFKKRYQRLESLEEDLTDMKAQAQAYLEKNKLIDNYPSLYQEMLKEEAGQSELSLWYFVLLGPGLYIIK